jgi:uncharacterized protein YciI
MEYIYKLSPTRPEMLDADPDLDADQLIAEHNQYLEDLQQQGVIILAGRTYDSDSTGFGIVIFRAASEEDAFEVMERDPGVRTGLMHAELYPFRLAYEACAEL